MLTYTATPLSDAELDEIERYTQEALGYRHQPEFVAECARLLAEVRRLRAQQEQKRWSLEGIGKFFVPLRRFSNGV
jgi:hypothetical protein